MVTEILTNNYDCRVSRYKGGVKSLIIRDSIADKSLVINYHPEGSLHIELNPLNLKREGDPLSLEREVVSDLFAHVRDIGINERKGRRKTPSHDAVAGFMANL